MNLALFQELRSESIAHKTEESSTFSSKHSPELWSKPRALTQGPGRGWGCCGGPVPPRDSLSLLVVFLGQRYMAFSRCSEGGVYQNQCRATDPEHPGLTHPGGILPSLHLHC